MTRRQLFGFKPAEYEKAMRSAARRREGRGPRDRLDRDPGP
jgi:hypothetical protein